MYGSGYRSQNRNPSAGSPVASTKDFVAGVGLGCDSIISKLLQFAEFLRKMGSNLTLMMDGQILARQQSRITRYTTVATVVQFHEGYESVPLIPKNGDATTFIYQSWRALHSHVESIDMFTFNTA